MIENEWPIGGFKWLRCFETANRDSNMAQWQEKKMADAGEISRDSQLVSTMTSRMIYAYWTYLTLLQKT